MRLLTRFASLAALAILFPVGRAAVLATKYRNTGKRVSLPALVVILAVGMPPTLWAGPVTSFEDIAFEALTADMTVSTISNNTGYDTASHFTYAGTFDQTGWNGTFGGTYQGQPVTGTSTASIIGDPTWNITGGITTTTVAGKTLDTSINMTLVENKKPNAQGQTTYNLKDTTIGTIAPARYTGTLTESILANGDEELTGTLTARQKGRRPTFWMVKITNDPTAKTIESEFQQLNGRGPNAKPIGKLLKDNGQGIVTTQVAGNFQGLMNEGIGVVPEPSTLVGCGMSALLGLGYWHFRHRGRRSKPENHGECR